MQEQQYGQAKKYILLLRSINPQNTQYESMLQMIPQEDAALFEKEPNFHCAYLQAIQTSFCAAYSVQHLLNPGSNPFNVNFLNRYVSF
jgi:hypothetical protein